MNLLALTLALLLQEKDSPNLKPPPEVSKDAIAAIDRGAALMDEARKAKDDPLETVEKAIDEFKKADRLASKTWPAVHYHLGIAYQWTKEYNEARRRLERALDMNPNFHEAMVELGDVWAWLKNYPSAIKVYDRALAIKPDYVLAHRNKGIAYIRNDDYKKAVEAFEKALSIDDKDGLARQLLDMVKKEIAGPKWGAPKCTRESAHFVVECDVDQAYTDWISKNLELIYAKYSSIFPQQTKPKNKFRCYVFKDQKEYYDNGAPKNTGGFYMDFFKKLVFFRQAKDSDTLLVLYHEAFHQFLAYYLSDAPQWFNEGHGDYFGPSAWNEKTRQMDIRTNSWRLPGIQQAIRSGKYQPLQKLMCMTHAELYDEKTIGLNYAQSWSLVYFLWHYEKGKYAKCLQLYFKALMDGDGLRESYQKAFGKTDMAKLEEEWKAFTLGLR